MWNSLDNATVCAPSVNSFKSYRHFSRIDLLQDYNSMCDPRGRASPPGEASSCKIENSAAADCGFFYRAA